MAEACVLYGGQGGLILYGGGLFLYGGDSRWQEIPSLPSTMLSSSWALNYLLSSSHYNAVPLSDFKLFTLLLPVQSVPL